MRLEYTVTAKTVDEAYKKAIDLYSSLGEISMEEIISRGKKGFLGIGAQNAEIRISVDDGKEEKKPEAVKKVQNNDTPAAKKPQKVQKPQPKQPVKETNAQPAARDSKPRPAVAMDVKPAQQRPLAPK